MKLVVLNRLQLRLLKKLAAPQHADLRGSPKTIAAIPISR